MAGKENKGGELTNEQIEQELSRKGADNKGGRNYSGMQDTGEQTVRHLGTQVQKEDGAPSDEPIDGVKDDE